MKFKDLFGRRPAEKSGVSGWKSQNAILKTSDALRHIRQARQSPRLALLRRDLRERFSGRRCIVIGSAPGARIVESSPDDRVLCVNASGWLASQAGILKSDITVIAGWSLRRDNPVRSASVDAMRGLRTHHLLLLESGVTRGEAIPVLAEIDMRHDRLSCVDTFERAAIIGEAWGEEIAVGPNTSKYQRPSNGVFAASIAIWAGAREVVLCGFSLVGGHAYIDGDTRRQHVDGDRQFFLLAKSLKCRIATTSEAINDEFGLPSA